MMRRVVAGAILAVSMIAASVGGQAVSQAQAPGGARTYLPVMLNGVVLAGPPPQPATPVPTGSCTATEGFDQVHLAWVGEPSATLTVVWRTANAATGSQVLYRQAGAESWSTATGALRPSGASGTLHEATITNLAPNTAYEYCVRADGGGWSTPFAARTAPAAGPADFSVIYVADTGLVGRPDGLASGTQQVIDEIAKLKPNLVLGGGDYAYFDTDNKRFANYDAAIDAWFRQMQPVIAFAPLMATYGNHEYELDGDYGDVTPWADRLPTPPGFDNRRNFSFDVGDVHFVALLAATDRAGLTDAQIQWFEQDALAAKARGMRWILPYYHVTPFGDGRNHGPNVLLREDVGPLFERVGVKIALASHDQAYERSFPLVDVPATNRPTSSRPDCYTMQDGTTYVKVSPGGKQSNISGAFSPFASATKPAWTAARDNTLHHFARLLFSAGGAVTVEAWGVKGDGSAPKIVDRFTYTTGACP